MTDPEDLMRKIISGFEKSDLEPLLDALHDDVVWKSASKQPGMFRFGGNYQTKLGVIEALSQVTMDYTVQHMRPKEITVLNDLVWGVFDVTVAYDPMDPDLATSSTSSREKIIELEMAIRWRFKDGKIIEHQSFFDTAFLLVQGHPPAD
jgi:ketosteroid isomerase-like protein